MKYVIGGMKYSLVKSRTAVNFAIYLASVKKRDVLLVDADPSECASEYIRWRNINSSSTTLSTVQVHGSALKTEINKLESKFDDIVIDSGVGENLDQSLKVCNRLIVPFSAKDLGLWTMWTLANIESLVDNVMDTNPDIKAYSFFINNHKQRLDCKDIIETLRASQYLEFLESESLTKTIFGSEDNDLKSLKDMKGIKSSVSENMLEIFEGLSS